MGFCNSALANQDCYVDNPNIRGTYTGSCVNGKAHGQGESRGRDHYKGGFKDGKTDGKGVYTWGNGSQYDGEIRDGKRDGKGVYTWGDGSQYDGEYKDDKRNGLGRLTLIKGNSGIASWESKSQGFWRGDVYVVQGVFVNDALELECEPTKQACEKARIEKEKAEQVRLEQERKANEEACKSRYVGERLRLEAPYITTTFFIIPTTEYGYFPFEVKGVGKDRMTVQAVYQSGFNSQVESANVPCNTNKVY